MYQLHKVRLRILQQTGTLSVMVQGITLDSITPLRIIRAACKNRLSSNGSKMKCLRRLHQRIQAQELLAQQGATAALEDEISREPLAPAVPQVPTDEQRMKHYLTHQPYAPWCEFCISNRAREDVHQSVTGFLRLWVREQIGG